MDHQEASGGGKKVNLETQKRTLEAEKTTFEDPDDECADFLHTQRPDVEDVEADPVVQPVVQPASTPDSSTCPETSPSKVRIINHQPSNMRLISQQLPNISEMLEAERARLRQEFEEAIAGKEAAFRQKQEMLEKHFRQKEAMLMEEQATLATRGEMLDRE